MKRKSQVSTNEVSSCSQNIQFLKGDLQKKERTNILPLKYWTLYSIEVVSFSFLRSYLTFLPIEGYSRPMLFRNTFIKYM